MSAQKQVVVVGGGVAAKGFIAAVLKYHPGAKITVITETEESIVPCGIPYVFGTLPSPGANLSPRDKLIKAGVEFRRGKVTGIERENHLVFLEDGTTVAYDKLVLATGTYPVKLPIPGFELEGVYTIQKNIEHVAQLKAETDKAGNIVVIGGGFIGVELSDEIAKSGRAVTLVEAGEYCLWQAFDRDFAGRAEEKLKERGVRLYTGTGVKELRGENGRVTGVVLSSGQVLPADLVISAVGVRPRDELAKACGLQVDPAGGVVVDRYQQTSDPDILAIGDVTAKTDFFDHTQSRIRLASVAATEGKAAALNLFRKTVPRTAGVISLFATAVGDLSFGAAGLTEKQAQEKNIDYVVTNVAVTDRHPGAMPGATVLAVKALFGAPEGRLVGAQVCGGAAVADFTNLLGLAIQNNLTAYELLGQQYGTHPMLTAGPTLYPVLTLAEAAIVKLKSH